MEQALNVPSEQQLEIEKLSQSAPQLNKEVILLALSAYTKVSEQGDVKNPVLTIIDYSVPSDQPRMWIFNMNTESLVFKTYVAHGRNSGDGKVPVSFSNDMSSKKSSLGTYITENTYVGHKGLSLNLEGLEKGLNSNAYDRRVVIHGAWYVEPSFIKREGRAGCSWGCPAIAESIAKPVINTIKNGSVVFAYYPDSYFLSHSNYISGQTVAFR
ncbi:murein L,D-transpeptidase catalytic domain family protein [Legionella gratiana]|nr:murein L,D-transpeptidase catalytic domain family protein [Legionella gratiana]